uniref:Somatomedin-B and thrombospondin type-1 domain-containing protein n=1 Tax=Schistocephalus solidus TaxID=70667 RepID=A0A0X3P2U1_SCHSO
MQYKMVLPVKFLCLVCVLFSKRGFAEEFRGSCRNSDGSAKCCVGRKADCAGQKIVFASFHHLNFSPLKRTVGTNQRCYCDEHCLLTEDCCPDYRQVCNKPKIDCRVSAWSNWSPCSNDCGPGKQRRSRLIIELPRNGGDQCPFLEETRKCDGEHGSICRFVRSGSRMRRLDASTEVANLLPVQGDIQDQLKLFDMRWDIRRKLYLVQLIQQNRTEVPDPEPYCVMYKIVQANPSCQKRNSGWSFSLDDDAWTDRRRRRSVWSSGWQSNRRTLTKFAGGEPKQAARALVHPWLRAADLLHPGQEICATCYPQYMRKDRDNRCPGTGYLGMVSKWRALRTQDCRGTFRMISMPRSACTCSAGPASFVLT